VLTALVALCLLFCFGQCSFVHVLTESTFSDFIGSNDLVFVEFFAPWCGHCKQLAPEWEKLAAALKDKVIVASVDCTTEQSVCQEAGVSGYPTLKFFKKGTAVPYQGQRSLAALQSWAEKKMGDDFKVANTAAEFEKHVQSPVVVGFFASKESPLFADFSRAASANEELSFVAVFDSSVTKDFAENTVKVYSPDQETVTFANETNLQSWLEDFGYPLIDHLSQTSFGRVTSGTKKYTILVFTPEDHKEALSTLNPVAAEFRKELGFLWDQGANYKSHAGRLGITGDDFPALVAMDHTEKFYPMTGEFNSENIKAFFSKLIAGEASPHLQSEEIPETNDGPVRVVVGKTFESEIVKSDKPVFLEVYAPWCGHCKSLAPIWEELGKAYVGTDVVIAKIDGSANHIPFQIQGFPTLVLFLKGEAEPIQFSGDRTLTELKQFLEAHVPSLKKEQKDEL
jgi:protein disulfide-isomerase A1